MPSFPGPRPSATAGHLLADSGPPDYLELQGVERVRPVEFTRIRPGVPLQWRLALALRRNRTLGGAAESEPPKRPRPLGVDTSGRGTLRPSGEGNVVAILGGAD